MAQFPFPRFSRTFGEWLLCRLDCAWSRVSSDGSWKHARSEQAQSGSSIHLALEHLEAVDLSFHGAVAPRLGQPPKHRLIVGSDSLPKAHQLRQVRLRNGI